jgi:hypothetical protein
MQTPLNIDDKRNIVIESCEKFLRGKKGNGYVRLGYEIKKRLPRDTEILNDKAFYKSVAARMKQTGKYIVVENPENGDFDIEKAYVPVSERFGATMFFEIGKYVIGFILGLILESTSHIALHLWRLL